MNDRFIRNNLYVRRLRATGSQRRGRSVRANSQGVTDMPFKKLWNTLCGRSTGQVVESNSAESGGSPANNTGAPVAVAHHRDDQPRKADRPKRTARTQPAAPQTAGLPGSTNPATPSPVSSPPRRGVLSLLSRGEHESLIRLIETHAPASLLEIGVGDGTRMPAILSRWPKPTSDAASPKIAVIDEFEMGGSPLSLRQYHHALAGLPVRPLIIPEPVEKGIVSVLHRLGTMDMVLVDPDTEAKMGAQWDRTVRRILHPRTVVLSQKQGKWSIVETSRTSEIRRAA